MSETSKVVDGKLQITRTHQIVRTRTELLQELQNLNAQLDSLRGRFNAVKDAKTKVKNQIAKLPEPTGVD